MVARPNMTSTKMIIVVVVALEVGLHTRTDPVIHQLSHLKCVRLRSLPCRIQIEGTSLASTARALSATLLASP